MDIDSPLNNSIVDARSFVSGLMIDLSLRNIFKSIDNLKQLEQTARSANDELTVEDCISGQAFFEESISLLLEERRNIMPDPYQA